MQIAKTSLTGLVLASTFLAVGFAVAPVSAGDENDHDQTCNKLWVERNQIYKNAGYCFKTARAREYFGNGDCRVDNIEKVILSPQDHSAIKSIKEREAREGC